MEKEIRRRVLLFSALLCLFYALGCLSFSVRIGAFERSPEISGECSVAGTVEEIGESKEYTLLTLGDIWLIDGTGNSFRPNAKLQLYIYGEVPAAEIGSAAMFDAEVQTYDAWAYGRVNANAVIGNTRYRASAAADKVVFSEGEGVGVFTAVRRAMRGVLFANMDEATASVAYWPCLRATAAIWTRTHCRISGMAASRIFLRYPGCISESSTVCSPPSVKNAASEISSAFLSCSRRYAFMQVYADFLLHPSVRWSCVRLPCLLKREVFSMTASVPFPVRR